ncbi:MAG: serine dehydratase [Clostridiales bacterium]|nr:serine dehydratase [Clostridiales bacterium]
MQSLRELYRVGRGPSSSHTMGPIRAAKAFLEACPNADRYEAVLYGSLAKTGRGHQTDTALLETFSPRPLSIFFDEAEQALPHPNTMTLRGLKGGRELLFWRVFSVGGGSIEVEGLPGETPPDIYPHTTFSAIYEHCITHNLRLYEYVEQVEGPGIWDYLAEVWATMRAAIAAGLQATGELAGGLHIQRKAKHLYTQRHIDESKQTREDRLICAYAFAVSEQNSDGGTVVTAPTCGSCGVMPAVLRYMQEEYRLGDQDILRALATGGLIGNLIKKNASISGAECGCQAEIGSACSMAAAALGELFSMGLDQIEYAAEVAMEHHLGLTCDPIWGLVQIPCIERNAVAAMRAVNALRLANFLTYTRKISFDLVVETMYQTGRDMLESYKETSQGGLAKLYQPEGSPEHRRIKSL